jgi:hypothetical protein
MRLYSQVGLIAHLRRPRPIDLERIRSQEWKVAVKGSGMSNFARRPRVLHYREENARFLDHPRHADLHGTYVSEGSA